MCRHIIGSSLESGACLWWHYSSITIKLKKQKQIHKQTLLWKCSGTMAGLKICEKAASVQKKTLKAWRTVAHDQLKTYRPHNILFNYVWTVLSFYQWGSPKSEIFRSYTKWSESYYFKHFPSYFLTVHICGALLHVVQIYLYVIQVYRWLKLSIHPQ